MSEWISVEDRLPALNVQCLVINKQKTIFIAWQYADGYWEYDENAQYCAYGVTHWMELPEPPHQPTDTEMLDWLLNQNAMYAAFLVDSREAIAAEMAKDVK